MTKKRGGRKGAEREQSEERGSIHRDNERDRRLTPSVHLYGGDADTTGERDSERERETEKRRWTDVNYVYE